MLWQCLLTYQNNIAHNPSDACDYINTYANCYSLVFNVTECGFAGSADHWWACEGAYQLTQAQFPNCYMSCSTQNGPPGFAEYLTSHMKTANGKRMLKLPDIFKQIDNKWQLVENEWITL